MDNIPLLLLLVLFGGAGLIAIFTIINLLLPVPVERARDALENSLVRSLLLGLVNFLFAGLVIALLSLPAQTGGVVGGIFIFLVGLVVLVVSALLILGLVALISLLANRMEGTRSPIASRFSSGILLILACLTPYFGWFVITPLIMWTALGASIQMIFRKRVAASRPDSPTPIT